MIMILQSKLSTCKYYKYCKCFMCVYASSLMTHSKPYLEECQFGFFWSHLAILSLPSHSFFVVTSLHEATSTAPAASAAVSRQFPIYLSFTYHWVPSTVCGHCTPYVDWSRWWQLIQLWTLRPTFDRRKRVLFSLFSGLAPRILRRKVSCHGGPFFLVIDNLRVRSLFTRYDRKAPFCFVA